jgi:tetratricopeptide (TPR) repeat protein
LATVEYKRSLGYERQLKAADPRNTKADEDLSWALVLYGAFLSRVPARHGEALAALQEAVNLGSLMPSEELGDTKEEGEAEVRIGQLLMQQGQTDEARKRSLAGLAIMRRLAEPADAAPLFRGLYAWALLHAEPRDLRSPETALLHAQAASDAAHGRDVKYLDLLAEAYNQAGHAQQAVTLERQVLALLPDPADRVDYERNLNRFQAALHKAPHK